MKSPSSSLGKVPGELTAIQLEMIEFFAQVLRLAGLPKSVSRIYGLVFSSERPLCFEDVVQTLGISSGSGSQGLRLLRQIGAVRTTYVPGGRRDYYVAETDLRRLSLGFMRALLDRHFTNSEERLAHLQALLTRDEASGNGSLAFVRERLATLSGWGKKARAAMPLVCALLEPGERGNYGRIGNNCDR